MRRRCFHCWDTPPRRLNSSEVFGCTSGGLAPRVRHDECCFVPKNPGDIMKRLFLTALLLSGYSVTLLAQSAFQTGLSPFDPNPNAGAPVVWTQPNIINFPSGTPVVNSPSEVGGFNPALVPDPYIHLNGGDVVVDSWTAPAPEPGSGFLLLFGAALAAGLIHRQRSQRDLLLGDRGSIGNAKLPR